MAKEHPGRSAVERELFDMRDLISMLLMSETTIRELIAKGKFPAPVYPTASSPRWTRGQNEAYVMELELQAQEARERAASTPEQKKTPRRPGGSHTG